MDRRRAFSPDTWSQRQRVRYCQRYPEHVSGTSKRRNCGGITACDEFGKVLH